MVAASTRIFAIQTFGEKRLRAELPWRETFESATVIYQTFVQSDLRFWPQPDDYPASERIRAEVASGHSQIVVRIWQFWGGSAAVF